MKSAEITSEKLGYYIAEDIPDAAERLQHEMNQYAEWRFAGTSRSVKKAITEIQELKPQLIFCDWDLVGGSGFEILQAVNNIASYNPFIIFNTGFQSDYPEIAEELINTYKPDAFINKPYWHKLRQSLAELLEKAKLKSQRTKAPKQVVWLCDIHGKKIPVVPEEIICVLQSNQHPRAKTIYTETDPSGTNVIITWSDTRQILDNNKISFFTTNKRYSIVVKKFIESYNKPLVLMKNITHKIVIVPDYIKDFEYWLEHSEADSQLS